MRYPDLLLHRPGTELYGTDQLGPQSNGFLFHPGGQRLDLELSGRCQAELLDSR